MIISCVVDVCTDKNLDTRHIIARRYVSSDSLDNIINYCRQPHRNIEPPRKMGPITNMLFTTDKTRRIYHDSATADRTEDVNPNNGFVTIRDIIFD